MDIRKTIDRLESLPLENLIVRRYGRRFEIYPWIKVRIFHMAMMQKEQLKEKSIRVFFDQLWSVFYGFRNFFRSYDTWAFTNSSERIEINGKYTDKLFDHLTAEQGVKTLLIELRLFKQYRRKDIASRYVVSKSVLIFLEEIYTRLFLHRIHIENSELLDEIKKELGVDVDTLRAVKKGLAQYRIMKFLLATLPNPKAVFFTVSYGSFGYIKALKERGIRVVEMQHGLIGEGHYAYYYYREFCPDQFPDDLLTFGDQDVGILSRSKIPLHAVYPVGSYVIDYYSGNQVEKDRVDTEVLVSLQDEEWSMALLEFVVNCAAILTEVRWIIKTRRSPESFYREHFDFPASVTFTGSNLYESLTRCSHHLTIFSTTAIEALALGIPVLLFNYKNASREFLGGQLANNPYVRFVNTPEEMKTGLSQLENTGKEDIKASNSATIYPNFHDNMNKYLAHAGILAKK